MLKKLVIAAALTLGAAFTPALSSTAKADTVTVETAAPAAPPTVVVETVPVVAPAAGYVWIHGHWYWNSVGWVWNRGYYTRAVVGHYWVHAHYVRYGYRTGYRWGYVRGCWHRR